MYIEIYIINVRVPRNPLLLLTVKKYKIQINGVHSILFPPSSSSTIKKVLKPFKIVACILKTNTNLKADRSVEIACTCRQIIGLPTSSCWLVFPKDFAASSSSVSSSCEASRLMTAHREEKT